MEAEEQPLRERLDKIAAAKSAIEALISFYAEPASMGCQENTTSLLAASDDPDTAGSDISEEIKKCRTQRDVLYVLARANRGIVDVNPASDIILKAGLSSGKKSTVVSTIHHFMTTSSDWEKISPGRFLLVADLDSVYSEVLGPDDDVDAQVSNMNGAV